MLSSDAITQLVPASRRQQFRDVSGVEVAAIAVGAGAIRIIRLSDGRFVVAPTLDGEQRALAGDGISAAAWRFAGGDGFAWDRFGAFIGDREMPVTVDQTNESCVLGDAAIIKWQLFAEESAATAKEVALHQAGFIHTPPLYGHLWWTDDDGVRRLVASVIGFVADSSDGWTWCPAALSSNQPQWPSELGRIVADMHTALSGTAPQLDQPQIIHGDLHVGQVLRAHNRFYVIDFDGDPLATAAAKAAPQLPLLDVASMMCSFTHAGMVAIKNGAESQRIFAAIRTAHEDFLDAYLSAAEIAVTADIRARVIELMFAAEQRELRYAEQYLQRWLYAPQGAITFMEDVYGR